MSISEHIYDFVRYSYKLIYGGIAVDWYAMTLCNDLIHELSTLGYEVFIITVALCSWCGIFTDGSLMTLSLHRSSRLYFRVNFIV